jgi:phospholipid/cholesterol/gamma-HCH transport system substrate-binding protein
MKKTLIALCVAAALLAGACSSDEEMITVSARFDDVGDLYTQAPVHLADITVGKVTSIGLDGTRALVEMELDPAADIPDNVEARVRRTSVLGERIIDLVIPEDSSGSGTLVSGDVIDETTVRSDLEDLVDEGSELLGAVAADDLATMIDEGGRGFGGQGEELRGLLQNYDEIVKVYADRSGQINNLIDSMANFNETLAAQAPAHERAVMNSNQAIGMLNEESDRLLTAIESLNRLSVGGSRILRAHSDEMIRFFDQTARIMKVLAQEQDSLELFLKWAPGHNANTQRVEYIEFNQVVQEFVICGLNDNPKDPARTCKAGAGS